MPPLKQRSLKIRDILTPVFKISTAIALLAHTVGIFGLTSSSPIIFRDTTIYNLLAMFLLLIWNEYKIGKRFVTAMLLAFSVGFLMEVISVNTNFISNSYTYTEVLGFQIFNVPIIIGLNWFKITFCAYVSSIILCQFVEKKVSGPISVVFQKPLLFAIVSSFIATAFNYFMQPVAITLGFWNWDNNTVPASNYLLIFLITFILSRIFYSIRLPYTNAFTIVILTTQTLFFIILRFLL